MGKRQTKCRQTIHGWPHNGWQLAYPSKSKLFPRLQTSNHCDLQIGQWLVLHTLHHTSCFSLHFCYQYLKHFLNSLLRKQAGVQPVNHGFSAIRQLNLQSCDPKVDLVPGYGRVWSAWRLPGKCPWLQAQCTFEAPCQNRRLPALDWPDKPGCKNFC